MWTLHVEAGSTEVRARQIYSRYFFVLLLVSIQGKMISFSGQLKAYKSPPSWLQNLQGGVSTEMKSISLYFYSGIDDSPPLYFWPILLDPFIDHFMCFFFSRVRSCKGVTIGQQMSVVYSSMRCRTYLFLVVVSWCLGEAFIGYVAGMTGKTLGQCRHCRQNQTWMTCGTLQLWVAAARFHWSCSADVVRSKSQYQAVN